LQIHAQPAAERIASAMAHDMKSGLYFTNNFVKHGFLDDRQLSLTEGSLLTTP
jgi:hypothetical protein